MDTVISNQTYSVRRSRELVVDVEQLLSLDQSLSETHLACPLSILSHMDQRTEWWGRRQP